MIWIVLVLLKLLIVEAQYSYEDALKVKNLIRSRNIDPDILPIAPNDWPPLKVSAFFFINGLVDVDAFEETMRLTVSFSLIWSDYNLRWTANDSAIPWIDIAAREVWYPILLLSNSFGQQVYARPDPRFDRVFVEHTGKVIARMYQTYDIKCDSDIFKFPRDTMTCKLTFMSSVVTADMIIVPEKQDQMIAFDNDDQEWYMDKVTLEPGLKELKVLNESFPFSFVNLEIHVIRSIGYYLIVVQLPILMMSCLIVLSSFISVDDGERLGFVTELCLTYIVFLLLLDSILPKSSLPLLSVCVVACFCLSVLNVIESVVLRKFKALSSKQSEMTTVLRSIELQSRDRQDFGNIEIGRGKGRPWGIYARRLDMIMLCINVVVVIVILILNIGIVYSILAL